MPEGGAISLAMLIAARHRDTRRSRPIRSAGARRVP
jgi:hypothetical protein